MMKRASVAGVALLSLLSLHSPAFAQAAPSIPALHEEAGLNGTQRDEVVEMIEGFILNNPDVLMRALSRLGTADSVDSSIDAMLAKASPASKTAFADPAQGAVIVNREGAPHLTIAIDYACPFCRTLAPRLDWLMRRYPEVRVAFRETPILSAESELAARVGLAVARQGAQRYLAYHQALMGRRAPLTEQAILDAAAKAGADLQRVAADATDPLIARALEENVALMKDIGIVATPLLVAGEQIAYGALQVGELEALLPAHPAR